MNSNQLFQFALTPRADYQQNDVSTPPPSEPLNLFNEEQVEGIDPLQPSQLCSGQSSSKPKTSSKCRKHAWTADENDRMLKLHDKLGNKWSIISKHFPDKSENDVKNHFFSQLRMSLRKLNKLLSKPSIKKPQQIRAGVIYKVISNCEEQYKESKGISEDLLKLSLRIKQGLLKLLDLEQEQKMEKAFQVNKELKLFSVMIGKASKSKKKELIESLNRSEQGARLMDEDCYLSQENVENFNKDNEFIFENSSTRDDIHRKCSEEVGEYLIKPEETSQLLARPSFCLSNPLENVNMQVRQDKGYWFEFDVMGPCSFNSGQEQSNPIPYFNSFEFNLLDEL